MKNYIICNLAYGPDYVRLFTENHLKSVLDETNLPELKKSGVEVDYYIFSDRPSLESMGPNENVNKLSTLVNVTGVPFVEPTDYKKRYDLLGKMLRKGVQKALEKDAYLTVFAADGVVAKGFFPKMLKHIEGHGAVFHCPMRAAVEVCQETLSKAPAALTPEELFHAGYNNLHPLWNASHYEAAQFSKIPYTMLWNSGTGLLARSFSVSPMIFKPTEKMRNVNMADYDLPSLCENPKWLENWEDCPIVGMEPLGCFYPPFTNHKANPQWIRDEFGKHLHKSQFDFVKHKFYYPNKETANISPETDYKSDFEIDIIRMETK